MGYSSSGRYPYPPPFKTPEDAGKYCKQLYKSLIERDSRQDYVRDKAPDKDIKDLFIRPEWHGAIGNGVHDDTTALQAAATACSDYDTLFLAGNYYITTAITFSAKTNLKIIGPGKVTQATDNLGCFKFTGTCNNVEISGIRLVGPHTVGDAYAGGGAGIQVGGTGGDSGTTKSNFYIHGCKINGFTWAGIMIYACQSGATVPHCTDMIVSGNLINDCQNGIFIYKNASRIALSDNVMINCWGNSIAIDTCADSETETTQANSNISITGNVSYRCGSYSSGCGVLLKGDNSCVTIAGNSIFDTGGTMRSNGRGTGIRLCTDWEDAYPSFVSITGNTVSGTDGYDALDPLSYGIDVAGVGTVQGPKYIDISGNIITDTEGYGLNVSEANNVTISGNNLYNCNDGSTAILITGTATYYSTYVSITGNNVEQAGSGGNAVYLSYVKYINIDDNNFINFITPITGDGNAVGATENRIITRTASYVASSGTGEDDLRSTTLWQNMYKQYRGVRFRAGGSITGANSNKTIKLKVGTGSYTISGPASNENDWVLFGEFIFNDSSTEQIIWTCGNGAAYNCGYEVTTQNNATGDITLKITGECANASDVIYQRYWEVEVF